LSFPPSYGQFSPSFPPFIFFGDKFFHAVSAFDERKASFLLSSGHVILPTFPFPQPVHLYFLVFFPSKCTSKLEVGEIALRAQMPPPPSLSRRLHVLHRLCKLVSTPFSLFSWQSRLVPTHSVVAIPSTIHFIAAFFPLFVFEQVFF